MASGNGTSDPGSVAAAVGLARETMLLASILSELRSGVIEVAVGDMKHREMILDQFPVAGSKRVIAYRTGGGFDFLSVPTAGTLALAANASRLGLTLINSGTSAIVLYLSDALRPGVPAVWLAANGGSWDGRLGNVLWCGNVFAVAQGATSTLSGGEL